jgi:hypothetical protein
LKGHRPGPDRYIVALMAVRLESCSAPKPDTQASERGSHRFQTAGVTAPGLKRYLVHGMQQALANHSVHSNFLKSSRRGRRRKRKWQLRTTGPGGGLGAPLP